MIVEDVIEQLNQGSEQTTHVETSPDQRLEKRPAVGGGDVLLLLLWRRGRVLERLGYETEIRVAGPHLEELELIFIRGLD